MLATELLAKYREKVKSKNVEDRYAALTFALQIPSICARIEFTDVSDNTLFKGNGGGPKDREQYVKLIEKYENKITIIKNVVSINEFAELVYDLRCKLLHEGYIFKNKGETRFNIKQEGNKLVIKSADKKVLKFKDMTDKEHCCSHMYITNEIYVDFVTFCNCLYDIAEIYFVGGSELDGMNTFLLSPLEKNRLSINKLNELNELMNKIK